MNFRNYYQSRLLDSLSKSYDKKGKDTTGRGRKHELVDFVDTDPYKFVDSQSFEVVGEKCNDMVKSKMHISPVQKMPKTFRDAAGASKLTINKKADTTPVHQTISRNKASVSSRSGMKKSPAALTEGEQLQLHEKEDLKRAMEASLSSKGREQRQKRRRAFKDSHNRKQRTMAKLQKDLEKTICLVDAAKDLNNNTPTLSKLPAEEESDLGSEHVQPIGRPLPPATSPAERVVCHGDASSPIIILSEGGLDEVVTTPKQKSNLDISSSNTSPPSFPQLLGSAKPRMSSPQLKSVYVKRLNLNKVYSKKMKRFAAAEDTVLGCVTTPPRKAKQSDNDTTPTLDSRPSDRRQSATSDCCTSSASHRKVSTDRSRVHFTPLGRYKKQGDKRRCSASSVVGERTPTGGGVRGGFVTPDTPPLPAICRVSQVGAGENLEPKDIKRNLFLSCDQPQRTNLPARAMSNTPSDKRLSGLDKCVPGVVPATPPASYCQSPSPVDTHNGMSMNGNSVQRSKMGSMSLRKVGSIPTFTSLTPHSNLKESTGYSPDLSPRGPHEFTHDDNIVSRRRTPDKKTVAPDDTREMTKISPLSFKKRPHLVSQNIGDDSSDMKRIKLLDGPRSMVSPSSTGPIKGDHLTGSTKPLSAHPSALLSPAESNKPLRVSALHNVHGNTSPADYFKIILGSLDSYLSRMAVAQSKVVHRVRWGKPIMSSSKQSHNYLLSVKHSIHPLDKQSKYALKINHDYRLVSPEGSRMQASQSMHDVGENYLLGQSQGIVQTHDVNATDKERDEGVDGSFMPAEASPSHLVSDSAEHADDFIPLNSYEESEESQFCDPLHLCNEATGMHTTRSEAHEEENTEIRDLRNSEREMHGSGLALSLVEREPLPGTDELPKGTCKVILIGMQETVAGSSQPLSPLRRRTVKLSNKNVLRKHRLQDSEESDEMASEVISERLRSDSDVEVKNSPPLSEEDRLWLNSRKQHKISATSSKRPRICKVSTSTSRRKEKTKATTVKKKEAQTPRSGKNSSAVARLFCRRKEKGIMRDSLSESGVSTPTVVEDDSQVHHRTDRAPLKRPSDRAPVMRPSDRAPLMRPSDRAPLMRPCRSLMDSSDSDERDDSVKYPLKHSGPLEVAAGTAKDKCTIDLTEEPDGSYDSNEDTSKGGCVCPMCGKTFNKAEIQLHADACINAKFVNAKFNKEKGLSQCAFCKGIFPNSLIAIHMEQCNGDHSDDDLPVRKKASQQLTLSDFQHGDSSDDDQPVKMNSTERIHVTFRRSEARVLKKRAPQLLSLRGLQHTALQDIENDNENGGIIDITDHGHLQGHHSSSSLSPRGVPDAIQPHAILCEDGGYLINPSSISTSPIRSFTQLQDLDPDQRACYQNQFQAKARRSRGQKSVMSQSKGRWPNQFDELLGTAGLSRTGQGRGGWGHGGRGGKSSGHGKGKKYNWKLKRKHGWMK